MHAKSVHNNNNNKFKTALIASFTLLMKVFLSSFNELRCECLKTGKSMLKKLHTRLGVKKNTASQDKDGG